MRADVTLPLLLLLLLPTAAPLPAARNDSLRSTIAGRPRLEQGPRTFITVSAQVAKNPMRTYVLLWEAGGQGGGYWLCLWDRDPRTANRKPLASVDLRTVRAGRSGWWDTGIPAEDSYTKRPSFKTTELGRWAGLVPHAAGLVSTAAVGVSSMVTRPRWMQEHRDLLGPLPLTALFLPGTHDSGAYMLFNASDLHTQWPHLKYSVTQEEKVLWQLVFGVRYLDMRVAYYSWSDEFWVNHGIVWFWPLDDVLEQVLAFMRATEEVVVLDFHEFPVGFRQQGRLLPSVHDKLVRFLRKRLGAAAAPAKAGGWAATLDQLVAGGRRLVISYNNKAAVAANADFLWPAVSQKWGNVRTLDDLHEYLSGLYRRKPWGPWAAMAELTATTADAILDRLGGLRMMADSVNKNVTAWYRGKWGETVNAVAVDFFRGTAIVEAAIEWNLQRAAEKKARQAAGNGTQQPRAEPRLSTPRGPL